jgi:hypothetical protein
MNVMRNGATRRADPKPHAPSQSIRKIFLEIENMGQTLKQTQENTRVFL